MQSLKFKAQRPSSPILKTVPNRKTLHGVGVEGVGVEVHLYPNFQKCTRPADRSQSKSQSKSKSKPKPNEGVSKILGGGMPPKIFDTPSFGFDFDFD